MLRICFAFVYFEWVFYILLIFGLIFIPCFSFFGFFIGFRFGFYLFSLFPCIFM